MRKKDPTLKERMASFETDMCWLKKQISNHLQHHWAVTLTLLAAVLAQSVTIVVGVIKYIR